MPPTLVHYSDVENAYDDPERIGRLAGTLGSLGEDGAVVCGTGDNTAPGVLSLATGGRQALPFFEAVGSSFETFGNHDFDHGVSRTREIVADSPQTWLTANVVNGDDERFFPEETRPWALETVGGVDVGFVGVTDPATAQYSEETGSLSFVDPIGPVQEAVDALRDRGATWVVALSHLGRGDERLAAETDVDVVLGGHVHSEVIQRVDETVLTRPGVNGTVVFEVTLDERPTVTRHEVADGPLDESVARQMREQRAMADLDDVVAHVADPIDRTQATVVEGESRIGNFVADAYRWAADSDVGLQNTGGIREGPPLEGDVTVADLVSVVPFDAPVAVAEVTGAELRSLVRQCSGTNVAFGDPDWWNGHLSGLEIRWDWTEGRIESLTVGDDPVSDEATYTLATTEYLFHTDREFPVLTESHREETLAVQYEVLADYARAVGIDPAIEGRIVHQ